MRSNMADARVSVWCVATRSARCIEPKNRIFLRVMCIPRGRQDCWKFSCSLVAKCACDLAAVLYCCDTETNTAACTSNQLLVNLYYVKFVLSCGWSIKILVTTEGLVILNLYGLYLEVCLCTDSLIGFWTLQWATYWLVVCIRNEVPYCRNLNKDETSK